MQFVNLDEGDCKRITSPEWALFKHVFNLPVNTKNEIIYSCIGPSINNFYEKYVGQKMDISQFIMNERSFYQINGIEYCMAVNTLWYPKISNTIIFSIKKYIRLAYSLLTTYF